MQTINLRRSPFKAGALNEATTWTKRAALMGAEAREHGAVYVRTTQAGLTALNKAGL